jgi:hypothetical protein
MIAIVKLSLNYIKEIHQLKFLLPCVTGVYWPTLLVSALWHFTKNFRHHRNQLVPGATTDEAVSTTMT